MVCDTQVSRRLLGRRRLRRRCVAVQAVSVLRRRRCFNSRFGAARVRFLASGIPVSVARRCLRAGVRFVWLVRCFSSLHENLRTIGKCFDRGDKGVQLLLGGGIA